jgi:hypothetical protein
LSETDLAAGSVPVEARAMTDIAAAPGLDPWFRFPVRKMLGAAYLGGSWSFELPWGRILHTY